MFSTINELPRIRKKPRMLIEVEQLIDLNKYLSKKLTTFPQCNFSLEFPEILSQNYVLSLTECVWDFQNNALRDTQ